MKYELNVLESIIENAIDSKGISKSQLYAYDDSIYTESKRIKKAFINKAFSLKKDKHIKVYIQNHQTFLIRLTNKVFQKLKQSGTQYIYTEWNEFNLIYLQRRICQYLEDILLFIETDFALYFNHDAKIPECCRLLAKKKLTENTCRLITQLNYKFNCPPLKIAFHPILKYHITYDSLSFRKFQYHKELIRLINHTCLPCSGNISNCKLKNKLIYLNFNSYRFFVFLTQEIKDKYIMGDTICSQIEKLSYYLKEINQWPVNSNFIYKPERKSLNEQLSIWLIEEITYLERKRELSYETVEEPQIRLNKDFKIKSSHSVSQIAFFIKLLVEVGAITNNNQKELIRFFASHIKSRQTERISPESLRTKYYHVEEGAVKAIRDLIINMLNETNKK